MTGNRRHVAKAFEMLLGKGVLDVDPRFQMSHIYTAEAWRLELHVPVDDLVDQEGTFPREKLDRLVKMVAQITWYMQEDVRTEPDIRMHMWTSTWFHDGGWPNGCQLFRISGRVSHTHGNVHNVHVSVEDLFPIIGLGWTFSEHNGDLSVTTSDMRDPLSGAVSSTLSTSGSSSTSSPSSHHSTRSSSSPSSISENSDNVDEEPEQPEQQARPEDNETEELVAAPANISSPETSSGLVAPLEEGNRAPEPLSTAPLSRRRVREDILGASEGAPPHKRSCLQYVIVNVANTPSIDEQLREMGIRPSAPPKREKLPRKSRTSSQYHSFYSFSVDNHTDAVRIGQLVQLDNWVGRLEIVGMERNTCWHHMDVLGVLKAITLATFYSKTNERPPIDVHQAIESKTLLKRALENGAVKQLLEENLNRKGIKNLRKIQDWANKP